MALANYTADLGLYLSSGMKVFLVALDFTTMVQIPRLELSKCKC